MDGAQCHRLAQLVEPHSVPPTPPQLYSFRIFDDLISGSSQERHPHYWFLPCRLSPRQPNPQLRVDRCDSDATLRGKLRALFGALCILAPRCQLEALTLCMTTGQAARMSCNCSRKMDFCKHDIRRRRR